MSEEVINVESTATEIRTAETVAYEINFIKKQTQKVMLSASIEIGRRLVEAKSLVDHGHWSEWLQQNVNYSERTAQNIMKIYNQYSDKGMDALFSDNLDAFRELSYTQAVALLSLPTVDERAEFVKTHNIDDMSTRELQEAIKAQKEAEEKAEHAEKKRKWWETAANDATQRATEAEQKAMKAQKKQQQAEKKLLQLENELTEAENKETTDDGTEQAQQEEIKALQKQLHEAHEQLEQARADAEQQVKKAKEVSMQEADEDMQTFRANLDMVQMTFNKMIEHINGLDEMDKRSNYKKAAKKLLEILGEVLEDVLSEDTEE